ncbi:MAG: transcriptional regulator [Rhodospirillales bacterium]|jgi:Rrf2 family protein|nr:transcriptional regulator [Rhodospirillales bacterium]
MFTQKAKYALRALVVLADWRAYGPLPIQQVAERAHAPHKFLEAILLELRRGGVLRSTRGQSGGYALAMHPADIRLGNVIRIVDGPLALIACAIRLLMRQVRDATAAILDAANLDTLRAQPALAAQ